MTRRLVAALACRAGGSRLYGKPLQVLDLESGATILDHIVACVRATEEIEDCVLGISEGIENFPFLDVAKTHGISYVVGSERDVLWRLILCGRASGATDVFRITTECPFTLWEMLPEVWARHVAVGNDITVVDHVPDGVHFEIYSMEALERSHREGDERDRSEFCSSFPRRRPELFKIEVLDPPLAVRRLDLRLTVDYPEDLVLCRRVYEHLRASGPHIRIADIVTYLDAQPVVRELVRPYVDQTPVWAHVVGRSGAG